MLVHVIRNCYGNDYYKSEGYLKLLTPTMQLYYKQLCYIDNVHSVYRTSVTAFYLIKPDVCYRGAHS